LLENQQSFGASLHDGGNIGVPAGALLKVGINFRRTSGGAPLKADAACTIFSSAVRSEHSDRFYSHRMLSTPVWVKRVKRKLVRAANSNLCCQSLVVAYRWGKYTLYALPTARAPEGHRLTLLVSESAKNDNREQKLPGSGTR